MKIPNNIVILDVETTGLDPLYHSMHGVGACFLDFERVDMPPVLREKPTDGHGYWSAHERQCATEFAPDRAAVFDPEALAVCGVTQEQLEKRTLAHDYALEKVHAWLISGMERRQISGKLTLAGWNPQFDHNFLKFQYGVAGKEAVFPFGHRLLDIFSLACAYAIWAQKPVRGSAPTSAEACGWFGIEPEPEKHTAISGVQWEAVLLQALLTAFAKNSKD